MTAWQACTCADAHRHYLPDIAEPMLIAPESRVVCLASCVVSFEIRLSALSAESVRRVSVMTAQMPYPLPHNCARIQWCLTTIVIGAGSAICAAKECPK